MKNVEMKLEGNKLTITIDVSKDFGLSKSGKSKTVASTGGFSEIEGADGVRLNLNVIRKAEPSFPM